MAGAHQTQKDTEADEGKERSSPTGGVVYEAVNKEGEDELARTTPALAWSGLAAGLSMGFSVLAEALLRAHLPDAPWRQLIEKMGYSVGFLVVVLGRQQLFTENTLTVILPLLRRRDRYTLRNVGRLWGTVLLVNLIGAAAFAWVAAHSTAFEAPVREAIAAISREALAPGAGTILLRGIFAGWLIALMVWLMPFAESARVWVIIIITYVVGLGNFSHVIVGSIEAMYGVAAGDTTVAFYLAHYLAPSLAGNILGGVSLVAAIAHAQYVAHAEGARV